LLPKQVSVLKIISLNRNGLASKEKHDFLITLEKLKADIILFQEIHLSSLPGSEVEALYNFDDKRSGSTAVLSKENPKIKITNTLKSEDGRICAVVLK